MAQNNQTKTNTQEKYGSQRPRRTLSVLTGIRLKGGKGGVMPPFCSDVAWYPRRAKTLVRRKSMREALVDMLERMEKRSQSQKHRLMLLLLLDVPCRRRPKQTPSLLDISPATHVRVCPSSDKGGNRTRTCHGVMCPASSVSPIFPRHHHKKRARRKSQQQRTSRRKKVKKNSSGPRVVRIG